MREISELDRRLADYREQGFSDVLNNRKFGSEWVPMVNFEHEETEIEIAREELPDANVTEDEDFVHFLTPGTKNKIATFVIHVLIQVNLCGGGGGMMASVFWERRSAG